MSTNMQNVTTKTPDTAPSSGKTGSGMGLNLSSGMEAAVTAALSYLEQILCDINNKELQEYQGMATANQMASQYSAQNTIKAGEEMFIEALAQGLGSVVGSGISLGTMGIAELRDPNKAELAKVDQEVEGVQNYQKAIPKEFKPTVDERTKTPNAEPQVQGAQTQEEAAAAQAKVDHANEVQGRLKELTKETKFTDDKGKALVAERKVGDATQNDSDLIGAMDKKQATELKDALNNRLDKLSEQRQGIANKQSARRQTFSTVGQSLGTVVSGSANAGASIEKKKQAESQAASALSNSASQGMQSIMAQLLKTANDALSQAQQTIQTFATISNGNKFQG
ncbi:MAG: hypothetical protein KFB93_02970 [Simkaniaceae bacterium]|nr:MAG: hypothetical protein KFB93_02970 [Simkaniaceae bacterium]